MSKHLCVNCDETFDFDGEGRARCPKCMRVNGIRELTPQPSASAPSARGKWLGLAGGVALLAVAVYFAWQQQQQITPGKVASEPLSDSTVQRQLEALGVKAGDMATILEADDSVEAFAKRVAGDAAGAPAQAQAVVAALRERATKRAFVPWSLIDPRDTPPMSAAQTLSALAKDGAALTLYPFEVAALAVAALRTLDAKAMVVEILAFEGERRPPDPSGRLGYFGVALVDDAGNATQIFDPYGGRTTAPKPGDVRVLNDLEAIAAALNVRALYRALRQLRPAEAMTDAEAAVKLARRSASVRGGHAAVALANGGVAEGEAELVAAAELRRDSPQRNNLAVLHLAKGDAEAATKEIAQALADHREFAAGHATLASIHLATGDRAQALSELREAEQLDPELPNLALLWAHYYATEGDLARALDKAEQGVARRPNDAQAHLMLARIYRESSRYDEMRRSARRVVELVPETQRSEMEQMVKQLLGPTALDLPGDEIIAGSDAPTAAAGGDGLDLTKGSKLLGQQEPAAGGPSLMPEGAAPPQEDGPLLMLGDPSKLRLSEPGGKLQLKLGE